jgi:hypothetical protein
MPRAYPHSHIVEGKLVGFSVAKLYGESYIVQFKDKEGRRLKKDSSHRPAGEGAHRNREKIVEDLSAASDGRATPSSGASRSSVSR